MATVSITDLTNAKLDTDHIADIATSLSLTATDRLGTTKKTLQGAINSIAAIDVKGAWATSTAYVVKDAVLESGTWYICLEAHTSATFSTDLAAGKWSVLQGITDYNLKDYAVRKLDFVSDMKAMTNPQAGEIIMLKDYASGNGAGVMFFETKATTGTDDGGSVINHDTLAFRFEQIFGNTISVKQFGAVGGTPEHTIFQSVINYANTSGITRVVADGSKNYIFQDGLDFSGTSNITLDFQGATVTDDVRIQDDLGGGLLRGKEWLCIYNCSDVIVENFHYIQAATRAVGNSSSAPTIPIWVGGQLKGSEITTNTVIRNVTAVSQPIGAAGTEMMFIFVAGENKGSEFTNFDLSGDWRYGINFEFGLAPSDPTIVTDPLANGKLSYNSVVTNFNGTDLYNSAGFLRTGGAYGVKFVNCQGKNVAKFIDCTGGDKNVIRGSQTTLFEQCKHLTDQADASFLATAIVTIAFNNEQGGSPLPAWNNLDHSVVFDNCDFQGNNKTNSHVIRHVGNGGKTAFRNCVFSGANIGLITGPLGSVTYNSNKALTFVDCVWKDNGQHAQMNNETGISFIRNKFKEVTNASAIPLLDGGLVSGGHIFESCEFSGLISDIEWIRTSSFGTATSRVVGCEFNLFSGGTLPAIKAEHMLLGGNNTVIGGSGILSTPTATRYQVKGQTETEEQDITTITVTNKLDADRALTYKVPSGTRTIDGIANGVIGDVVTVINFAVGASTTFTHASGAVGSTERIFTSDSTNQVLTLHLKSFRFKKSAIGWHQIS